MACLLQYAQEESNGMNLEEGNMLTKIQTSIVVILFVLGITISAHATVVWDTDSTYDVLYRNSGNDVWNAGTLGYKSSINSYSGYYIGTIGVHGAGDNEFVAAVMDYYFYMFGDEYSFTKKDMYKAEDENSWTDHDLEVVVANGAKHGTWDFISSNLGFGFYGVKGANELALYFVDPAVNSGTWSTEHLLTPNGKNIPDISHLVGIDPPLPTPEPATVLLLGIGLAGLGIGTYRSRKR